MAYTVEPIPEDQIRQALEGNWGIRITRLTELFLGTGGDTGTFLADAIDTRYFLKLARTFSESGIAISLLLANRGLPAVAPILSQAGNAWEIVSGYQMVIYPFIEGAPIVPEALTAFDWSAIGRSLRAVHDTAVSATLRASLPFDGNMFTPWGEAFLPTIAPELVNPGKREDPFRRAISQIWLEQGSFPGDFFAFVKEQGRAALATTPVYCLCHNDFQSQNILRSAPGVIHLIDWEGATWAPPEKDLMFIAPEYRSQLQKGYGPLRLNESVMAYQRSNWLLQDLFDCVNRVLFKPNAGTQEKRWAIDLTISILSRMRALLA